MPKIKFTGLVTGMSGKGGGSVFASNSSGSYMRNNTSKVKPKTAANSVKKAIFSTTSQLWKLLSFEDQQAWNNAAPNFPKTNTWGDVVIPSGYQLFMSLNGTLATIKRPPLVLPPVGRSLPDTGEIELNNPDLFQFMPQAFVGTFDRNQSNAVYFFSNESLLDGSTITGLEGFTFRISFVGAPVLDWNVAQSVQVWSATTSDGEYASLTLRAWGSNQFKLRYQQYAPGGNWMVESEAFTRYLDRSFHIGIQFAAEEPGNTKMFFNGSELDVTTSTTGTPVESADTGTLYFGDVETRYPARFYLSDVRFIRTSMTPTEMDLISKGYLLDSERAIFSFNRVAPNGTITSEFGSPANILSMSDATAWKRTTVPMSANLIPEMVLSIPNAGLDGVQLNIYASPPISNGRGGSLSNWRLIGSIPWTEEIDIPVAELWATKFGSFPIGSNVTFKVEVFDTTTGVINAAAVKPPRKTRFKAGAEMSNHVNR